MMRLTTIFSMPMVFLQYLFAPTSGRALQNRGSFRLNNMRIVITDGFTLNPGDLSWDNLKQLGQVDYYDRSSNDETLARCIDADIIVTNKTPIDAVVIEACKKLKLIAVTAT